MATFGVSLVEVGLLRLKLKVVIACALVDFERVESIALEVGLAIQVHLLESQLPHAAEVARGAQLFNASNGRFLPFVLRPLLLLQFVHHRHFLN